MRRQRGFGLIAVIVVLVMLAALAGGLVALSSTQSTVLAQDALSARADQAARAGTQWGLFQAFSTHDANPANPALTWCDNAVAAPVMATVNTPDGFQVTVSCSANVYREGETAAGVRTIRVYQLTAVACPAGGACPRADGTVAASTYVERRRDAVGF